MSGLGTVAVARLLRSMEEQTDSRTLWIGDLSYWMDESLLYSLFASTNAVVSVKIIRNKATNLSEGYGFVEFRTHEAAEQVKFNDTESTRHNWNTY